MKTAMKKAIRDETGAALALALVLLVVGGLILTPLLGLMSTGLMAGKVYEKKAHEYYAADAGVEDAIWKIESAAIPAGNWTPCADRPGWEIYKYPRLLSVGNKSVDVVVYRRDWDYTCGENLTYQIVSTAVTDDGGGTAAIGSTTIDSYLDAKIVIRNLFDNAITSRLDIDLVSNCVVNGDVQFGRDLEGGQAVNGTKTPEAYTPWPDGGDLSDYYLGNVTGAPDPGPTIDLDGKTKTIGPCRRYGSLQVDNKGTGEATLLLQGTVYVDGDLQFMQSGSKDYTINLNGQTIFATGEITFPEAKAKVRITGSGCIIATGLIKFWPSMSGGPTDFVFVMSTGSYVDFKPNGDFYGSLAGDASVHLWPGSHMNWIEWRGKGINFPVEDYMYATDKVKTLIIRTWEINPQ